MERILDENQPSAQATEGNTTQSAEAANPGIQKRIDELTARFRQAEEQALKNQQQLLEESARRLELERRLVEQSQPKPQEVDVLAQYADSIDPTTAKAMRDVVEQTRRQVEAQFNSQLQAQRTEYERMQVLAEARAVPNLPPQVAQRAEQLLVEWRRQGFNVPTPANAIDIALGEYQRGQLYKAAPVMGYNPAAQYMGVTPGTAPAPAPMSKPRLPDNMDALPRATQLKLLEEAGVGDIPL